MVNTLNTFGKRIFSFHHVTHFFLIYFCYLLICSLISNLRYYHSKVFFVYFLYQNLLYTCKWHTLEFPAKQEQVVSIIPEDLNASSHKHRHKKKHNTAAPTSVPRTREELIAASQLSFLSPLSIPSFVIACQQTTPEPTVSVLKQYPNGGPQGGWMAYQKPAKLEEGTEEQRGISPTITAT